MVSNLLEVINLDLYIGSAANFRWFCLALNGNILIIKNCKKFEVIQCLTVFQVKNPKNLWFAKLCKQSVGQGQLDQH